MMLSGRIFCAIPWELVGCAVSIAGAMPPLPSPLGKVAERSEVG